MEVSVERIVTIIALMYGKQAELVVYHSQEKCYLFFDGRPQDLEIYYEEVNCLVDNEIIELDGGCAEEGHETSVYILTSIANQRISDIVKNNKLLILKNHERS
ncbi:MAG: hypothetical protein ACOYL8_02820 [Patescibacteria group bacterium]